MRPRMLEAQQPSMQTQTMQRVVTIAILHVATDGMPHIGSMYTNLVLASCLQLKLHQRVIRGAVQYVKMRNGQLTTIIYWRRIGNIGLVVLQPVLNGTVVLLHLARQYGNIATVIDYLVPVMLQHLLRLHILRIDH